MEISGVYEPQAGWLAVPLIALDEADVAAAGRPNLVFLWARPAFRHRVVDHLTAALTPTELTGPYLAQRPVMPLLLTGGTGQEAAVDLSRAIYLPGGEAMLLIYVFFGIGIFTLMLLAFLDRRRDLAVMKTLGLTSGQVALLMYLEVAVLGALGLGLGLLLLAGGIGPLRAYSGGDYRLSAWIVASGAALSLLALVVSVWLPIAMARLATVANLLGGEPFRLAGYERRWSRDQDPGRRPGP